MKGTVSFAGLCGLLGLPLPRAEDTLESLWASSSSFSRMCMLPVRGGVARSDADDEAP